MSTTPRRRLAKLARRRGDAALAARLEADAADLLARFNERLLDGPMRGSCAIALDGDKRRWTLIGSNAGHCLGAGSCPRSAPASCRSGSSRRDCSPAGGSGPTAPRQPGYNPLGYHTGTRLAPRQRLIAAGIKRDGVDDGARPARRRALRGGPAFPDFRLPELFCGFDRSATGVPVPYPVACSPQAWAAAVPLWLIRTSLGLRANAAARELELVRPMLPSGVDKLVIRRLRVGSASCDVLVHRWRGRTSAEVLHKDEDLRVTIRL